MATLEKSCPVKMGELYVGGKTEEKNEGGRLGRKDRERKSTGRMQSNVQLPVWCVRSLGVITLIHTREKLNKLKIGHFPYIQQRTEVTR